MAKQVSGVFAAEGVWAHLDFNFYPFGNGHFATKKCPETGHIGCWAKECSQNPPDSDCFDGVPKCQHGTAECEGNSLEGCVIENYPNSTQYWPFVDCFEAKGGSKISGAQNCAKSAGLDWSVINGCYTDAKKRNAVDKKLAQATLQHNCHKPDNPDGCPAMFGVPNVYVNDAAVNGDLLTSICNAITGTKPKGCK